MEFNPEIHFLGELCNHGHDWQGTGKSLRYKNSKKCQRCVQNRSKKFREENRETYLQWKRNYANRNKEKIKARQREFYLENHEENLARNRRYSRSEKARLARKEYSKKNCEKKKQYMLRYREENLDRLKDYTKKRYHNNKDKFLAIAREYREKNREKINYRKRKLHAENPEKYRAFERARRARIKNVTIAEFTPEEVNIRFADFDNLCAYCNSDDRITADHFISLKKGGGHCIGNIIPACKSCNSGKRDRDPQDWYEQQPFYSKKRWQKILNILGKKNPNQLPLF